MKSDITKPVKPTFDFEDTGLLNNDGVTSNGVITVSDRGVDISINHSGLQVKYWACAIYDNTQSIFTYI
jgi:hypothetical protein